MYRRNLHLMAAATALAWANMSSARGDALPLDTVVVTATRLPTQVDLVGSAVSVVTGTDLASQQIVPAYDMLRQLPGIEINNTGGPGGTTSLFVRGLSAEYTKVLIDGIDVADQSSTQPYFDFADLLSADIGRIELVRGAESILYGSNAMGGVVNIVTKSGRTDPGASVMAEGGSYGTFDGAGSVRGVTGPLDYSAAIEGEHTDGIVAADAKNGNHMLDPYDNLTASLKLDLAVGDQVNLGTVFRYVDARHDYPGYSFVTELPADAPGQQQATREIYSRAYADASFLDGAIHNSFGVDITRTERDYLQYSTLQYDYLGATDALDDQATWQATPWLSAVVGAETREDRYDDSTGLDATQRTNSGYGELQFVHDQTLAVTAGVRTDQVSGVEGATTYRFTGAWQPLDIGPRLHATYGTGFEAPSLYERFVVSPYVVGDPSLRPETDRSWDLGFGQALGIAGLSLDATYFHTDLKDLIDGTYDQNFVFHYVNIDRAKTYGAEFSAIASPLPTLDLKAAYTWLRTEDLSNGGELLRRPHHTVSGTATWHITDTIQSFATLTWVGARNDDDFQPAAPPVIRLDPYTLLSFGGSWQVTPELQLFGRVENALDRRYEEVFGYGTAGRAAYAGVKANF
jgi:vitamin B12 transporter